MKQDEEDRKCIQLTGMHESQQSDKPLLTIDKNCLSCLKSSSNQQEKNRVLNAFKLACLTYNPSKVKYQSTELEKGEIIEKVMKDLELISGPKESVFVKKR